MEGKPRLTVDDFLKISSNKELREVLVKQGYSLHKVDVKIDYENELRKLQIELVKLQQWIAQTKERVAVIFDGRVAAGKGGNIRIFMEHLNPRSTRLVALNNPTDIEKGQWYFQRYIKE